MRQHAPLRNGPVRTGLRDLRRPASRAGTHGSPADHEAGGVVSKRTLPPPTPATVYELTEAARALAPLLRELRTWGARYGPAPQPRDAVRSP